MHFKTTRKISKKRKAFRKLLVNSVHIHFISVTNSNHSQGVLFQCNIHAGRMPLSENLNPG